ncbi:MAG: hypothetical protein HC860_23345 [Alkalinema sp. RU_4_3]|nr:hypothetical protein [Alkalinema sp. RU_4_3]
MSGRSSNSSPPLMELALLGGLILLVLVSVLRWRSPIDPNSTSNEATRNELTASTQTPNDSAQSAAETPAAVAQPARAIAGTHKVLCETGNQGLNLRPTAGLSAPTAILPCGGVLTVTGNPVTADGLLWSPVNYGQSSGWVASYLIRRL